MSSFGVNRFSRDISILMIVIWMYGFISGFLTTTGNEIFGMHIPVLVQILNPFVLVLIFIFLLYKVGNSAANQIRGIKGEWKTSTILHQMWDDGVRHLDDVLLTNRGNIDHVAIASTGVWVIETKHIDEDLKKVNGVLIKNGKRFTKNLQHDLKQAYAEAKAVHSFFARKGMKDVPVYPVLAFVGSYARIRVGLDPVDGVFIVGSLGLRRLILDKKRKEHLSSIAIAKMVDVLKPFQGKE